MDARVQEVVHFLSLQSNRRIKVEELAQRVGLSISRLEHLFKQELGFSIKHFLLQRRLSTACDLLIGTDLSIKEISYLSGFQDPANFCHLFKRRYGLRPTSYRLKGRRQRREREPAVSSTSS